jgi:hypothetical protein
MTTDETTTLSESKPKRTRQRSAKQNEVLVQARERLARVRELEADVRPFMNYLTQTPTRGRPFDIDRARERLHVLDHLIANADVIRRLALVQERLELVARVDGHVPPKPVDLEELEARFVQSAREYGELKGLSYAAWRACGVPPKVLAAAGIAR